MNHLLGRRRPHVDHLRRKDNPVAIGQEPPEATPDNGLKIVYVKDIHALLTLGKCASKDSSETEESSPWNNSDSISAYGILKAALNSFVPCGAENPQVVLVTVQTVEQLKDMSGDPAVSGLVVKL